MGRLFDIKRKDDQGKVTEFQSHPELQVDQNGRLVKDDKVNTGNGFWWEAENDNDKQAMRFMIPAQVRNGVTFSESVKYSKTLNMAIMRAPEPTAAEKQQQNPVQAKEGEMVPPGITSQGAQLYNDSGIAQELFIPEAWVKNGDLYMPVK